MLEDERNPDDMSRSLAERPGERTRHFGYLVRCPPLREQIGSRIRQAAPERGEVGGDRAALLRRHGREVAARRLVQMERELVRADPSERRSKAVDRASRVRDGRVASPIRCLELEVQVDLL